MGLKPVAIGPLNGNVLVCDPYGGIYIDSVHVYDILDGTDPEIISTWRIPLLLDGQPGAICFKSYTGQ